MFPHLFFKHSIHETIAELSREYLDTSLMHAACFVS